MGMFGVMGPWARFWARPARLVPIWAGPGTRRDVWFAIEGPGSQIPNAGGRQATATCRAQSFLATNKLASTPGVKSTPGAAVAWVKPGVVYTPGWELCSEARGAPHPHPPVLLYRTHHVGRIGEAHTKRASN